MSDGQEQSHAAWRQLEYEWHRAREGWRDSTTWFFDAQFWEPLTSETSAYLRDLDALMETLRAAQQAARTW